MAAVPHAPRLALRRRRPVRSRSGRLAFALPAAAGLVVFFLAPLAAFGVYSFLTAGLFSVSGPLTLDNYRTALESDLNRTLARNSLTIGLATGLMTVAVSLPVAYWLRYVAGRWRTVVLFLIVASFFASYLVRIYAWRTILGGHGVINSGLEGLGIEPLGFILYSRFAVVVALVHIYLPVVVLVLYAALAPLTPAYLETAQDLGAGALTRWRRLVLPVMAGPAVSAFLFVFVLAAADYVTPQFLGGTNGAMLGVQIQANFTGTGNFPLGAAIAFAMLAGFLVCWALCSLGLRLAGLSKVRFAT
jgi:spermidine/putrescine transport system permease protein